MVRVLALIKDGERLVGLRLFDEKSTSIGDFKLPEASKLIMTYGCSNARITNGELESTECSIERLPVFDTQRRLLNEGGIFILLKGVYNKQTFYDIVNVNGVVKRLSENTLIKYANAETQRRKARGDATPALVNAKVVDRGDKIISAIRGCFKEIQVDELKKPRGLEIDKYAMLIKELLTEKLSASREYSVVRALFIDIYRPDLHGLIIEGLEGVVEVDDANISSISFEDLAIKLRGVYLEARKDLYKLDDDMFYAFYNYATNPTNQNLYEVVWMVVWGDTGN